MVMDLLVIAASNHNTESSDPQFEEKISYPNWNQFFKPHAI